MTNQTKAKRLAGQLAGYSMSGGFAAIIDIGGFAILIANGVSILLAAISSFLIAMVFNYCLSAVFVFKQRRQWRSFFLFAACAVIGLLINTGTTVICAAVLGMLPIISKIIGVGTAFIFNFILNAFFVFKPLAPAQDVTD